MNLQKSFFTACLLSLMGVGSWELYWRSEGVRPAIEDNKDLWAVHRARVENADASDVIILGSSRALFDILPEEWKKYTGVQPIQLATAGSTPLPAIRDIVDNTDFSGTLIVGVTPGLFFSTTQEKARPWERMQSRITFYHNRTYAQRLNHWLSIPLERNFAFICKDEEDWDDDINLESLLARVPAGTRVKRPPSPPFNRFQEIDLDRNMRLSEKVLKDTAFANSIKAVWKFFTPEDRKSDKESTMAFFLKYAAAFKDRGGNLILVRCPSEGYLREIEHKNQPRKEYWDELVKNSGAKAYHFEDYVQLQGLSLPESSHLSPKDAAKFTRELITIMQADGAIPNH
jgi:hypothetical protein